MTLCDAETRDFEQGMLARMMYGPGCPNHGLRLCSTKSKHPAQANQCYYPSLMRASPRAPPAAFAEDKIARMDENEKLFWTRSLGIDEVWLNESLKRDNKTLSKVLTEQFRSGRVFDHGGWNAVLKACVTRGTLRGIETSVFDYKKLCSDAKLLSRFEAYIESLEDADFRSLRHDEKLAFLCNAYNAITVRLIVRHMKQSEKKRGVIEPPKSIRDLGRGVRKVWDIAAGKLFGANVTLSTIEHKMLRARWSEPRIHACIVCASASCPDLRAEAFVGERLDEQMTEQMSAWLANPNKGLAVSPDAGSVQMSRIFDWFSGDFKPNVRQFINSYSAGDKTREIREGSHVGYFVYDWGLNSAAFAKHKRSGQAKS